jgi:long-chain acyl-CoA synthetase
MTTVLSTEPTTLPELLRTRAQELPDERFVRDVRTAWTYGEFTHRVTEIAGGLQNLGVGRGDVVGVILRNGPEYLEVWWAILWLGAVFNPVNPELTPHEVTGILSDSGASVVICDGALAAELHDRLDELPQLRETVTVEYGPDEPARAGDPLKALRAAPIDDHAPVEKADLASLVYTSGTTGRPKGAMLTHGNFLANAWQLAEPLPLTRGDTMGMVLPLFHVNAQVVTTVVPLLLGARTAMWDRFSASTFWGTVARFEPVTFSAVPTMLAALLHAPGADKAEMNTLRFVICGAAPLSPALFRRFEEKFGLKVLEGYGLTEGTCCSTINPFLGPRKIGSIGIPTRGQQVVIMDERGAEVADSEPGEVCVRGPNVMQGYYNRPDATGETLRDGWLRTGDVGYRDADGFFFLVDRKKDMIIRGGENIYPREIEDVLLEHAGVQGAAVIGRPDEVRGEEVHAVVVLAPGTELADVETHCRKSLAPFKVPSSWDCVDELPTTSTGKIDKKPLRAALRGAVT